MKKLWVVKREVLANSITEALRCREGRVYEISEAAKDYQPIQEVKVEGFTGEKK